MSFVISRPERHRSIPPRRRFHRIVAQQHSHEAFFHASSASLRFSTLRGGERNPIVHLKTAQPLYEAALQLTSFDDFDDPVSARIN